MKVIAYWQAQSKSKRLDCKSYTNLIDHYQDKFIPAKMQFFRDITKKLNVFFTRFQTNNPIMPFLSDALVKMFTSFISMVIKQNVLNDSITALKLVKIDMTDKENQLDAVPIKLGTALKEMLSALGVIDVKIQNFKKECKDSVIAIIAKLQERSPLQYTVVRMASSLSPHNMVRAKEKSLTCFDILAEKVVKLKWMSPDEVDEPKTEYPKFIDTECVLFKDKFLVFDAANDRVDTFLGTVLHGQK